jgi:hypothetical protein
MKLATIALFVAVIMGLALGTSSLLQHDSGAIGLFLDIVVPGRAPTPEKPAATLQTPTANPASQPGVAVPSGTFQGPTGQPNIQGPPGPPPENP